HSSVVLGGQAVSQPLLIGLCRIAVGCLYRAVRRISADRQRLCRLAEPECHTAGRQRSRQPFPHILSCFPHFLHPFCPVSRRTAVTQYPVFTGLPHYKEIFSN